MQLYNPSTGYSTFNNQSYGYYFLTGGGTKMTILNNGNVGIGTTSPSQKLTVVGNTYISSGLLLLDNNQDIRWGDAGERITGNNTNGLVFTTNNLEAMRINSAGNVGIGDASPTSISANTFSLSVNSSRNDLSGALISKANGTVKHQQYWDSSGYSFNLSAGAFQFNGGNVGIGTTSPDNTLDVVASDVNITPNAESSAVFRRNGNNYLTILSNASNEGGILFGNAVDDNDGSISYKHNTQSMQFATADAERMRITSAGNVGIGTTSPSEKLVVDGKVIINNAAPPNNLAQLNIGYTGSGETRAIDIDGSWSGGENKSITFTHGNAAANIVGQINCVYNGPGSRIRWGKLYHSGDSSTYTMELESTSTTTANLTVAGSIQMADDTATASATKVGTMRYRTGTEYVEVTGTEIAVNGDFTSDTSWGKGTGWTIANGLASSDGTQTGPSYLTQATLPNPSYNKTYKVTFTISNYVSGTVNVLLGGYEGTPGRTGNGTATQYKLISQVLSNTILYVQASANFVGSIDNLSVIEVTAEDASYADMCMQTGASTYEWVNIVRNTY
jgi:hypothetical protein